MPVGYTSTEHWIKGLGSKRNLVANSRFPLRVMNIDTHVMIRGRKWRSSTTSWTQPAASTISRSNYPIEGSGECRAGAGAENLAEALAMGAGFTRRGSNSSRILSVMKMFKQLRVFRLPNRPITHYSIFRQCNFPQAHYVLRFGEQELQSLRNRWPVPSYVSVKGQAHFNAACRQSKQGAVVGFLQCS